jgi:quercetin dioxygenase-like cupin family protein
LLKVGDVLDFGPLGMKFYIKKTAAETNGQSFEMEMELDPQRRAGIIHIHPHALETYEVLQGKFDVYVNGNWQTRSVGEKVAVEKGVPHTFRNASNETTRIYNTHQPALKIDQFFEGLYKLANSGVSKSNQMTFKTILYLSVVYASYQDEIQSVRPPNAIMQVFAFFGRLLGYKV